MRLKYSVPMLCMIMLANTAHATHAVPSSARPVVIELFTSQGCNSCPPADALLGEYANNPDVIALSFHVDYWDYLGWRDPFALSIGAQRQRDYVRSLNLSSAFTPQMIIEGAVSMVGSDRRQLSSVINRKYAGIVPGLLNHHDSLTITLPESGASTPFNVNLIAYRSYAETPVPRGENAGHALKEYNIVRNFQALGLWNGHATTLNAPLTGVSKDADHIAVLIQKGVTGEMMGATTIAL